MKKNILLLLVYVCSLSIGAQTLDEKYAVDVKTVSAIVDAYYDVISGSSEDPWQYERDAYIHLDNAVITRIDEHGISQSHNLEVEYMPLVLTPREDFYEKELKRVVSQYGNIAQVWSAFEIRTDPDVASNIKGLNSIQLHFEKGRWWIDSWTCEMESENNALVKEFLNK